MQTQEDRNKALESAAEDGVIRNYTGWRQSLKGTRFQIKDCTLFNLETPTEKKVLQIVTHHVYMLQHATPVVAAEGPDDWVVLELQHCIIPI